MPAFSSLKAWALRIRRDTLALWLAARDPRVPWSAKFVAAAVVAYALSPIDLIPDFIPVIGYLDDLIIVPLGIMLAVRLMPAELMAEFRAQAAERERAPRSLIGLGIVVTIWAVVVGVVAWRVFPGGGH